MAGPAQAMITFPKAEVNPQVVYSAIEWHHYKFNLPAAEKTVLVVNAKDMLFANNHEGKTWTTGLQHYKFEDYPYWAHKPFFYCPPAK